MEIVQKKITILDVEHRTNDESPITQGITWTSLFLMRLEDTL